MRCEYLNIFAAHPLNVCGRVNIYVLLCAQNTESKGERAATNTHTLSSGIYSVLLLLRTFAPVYVLSFARILHIGWVGVLCGVSSSFGDTLALGKVDGCGSASRNVEQRLLVKAHCRASASMLAQEDEWQRRGQWLE